MNPEQMRRLHRAHRLAGEARGERLVAYLREGGNPDVVQADLIPTVEDQVRLEREIKSLGGKVMAQPKGKRRDRKMNQLLALVAELVVVERVLAMDAAKRAALRPSDLATLAHVDRRELLAQVSELVAGTVGGGLAPTIEVARG